MFFKSLQLKIVNNLNHHIFEVLHCKDIEPAICRGCVLYRTQERQTGQMPFFETSPPPQGASQHANQKVYHASSLSLISRILCFVRISFMTISHSTCQQVKTVVFWDLRLIQEENSIKDNRNIYHRGFIFSFLKLYFLEEMIWMGITNFHLC